MNASVRLFSGLGWSALSQGVRIFLQLASIPLLARLLHPSDFGIYAMCMPVLGLAGLLQDFGLQQALVQKDRLDKNQMNMIFWINFGISLTVAASMFLLSGSIASFFSEPALEDLMRAFSLITLLGAIGFGQYALLNRDLRFKLIALIDMTCAIVSFIVVIICGFYFRSYWALWAGGIASVITWILFSYLVTSWRPGFPRRVVDLDGMFRFGLHIMVHNFAVYFSRNFDSILIGKFLGTYSLGLYDRAYKVLLFPIENLAQPISRVMVPMLARGRGDRDEFSKIFVLANSLLHLACLPALAALIGSSDQFILVFLGKSFSDVAPIFFWLGFAGFVQPLIIASHWVLLSEGRSHTLMIMSLTSALFVSLCLLIGLRWGLIGVAIAYVCGEVFFRVPMMIWTVGRASIISYAVFFRNVTPIVASAIFTFLFTHFLNDIVSGLGLVFLNLGVAYLLGLLFLAVFPHGRAFLREVRLFLEIWFSERVR